MDVVPVEPGTEDDWSFPPFEGRIANGYVWGRGTLDDKVRVLGILEAVEILLSQQFRPRRTVYLAFGHDEEVGGLQGASKIASLLRSRGVQLEYVLDEGGVITHGIIPGVPKPVALVGIAEKGYLSVELTVEGQGGHSSMPPRHTPVGVLSTAIHNLERNQFPVELRGASRKLFDYLAPEMPFSRKLVFANLWLLEWLVKCQLSASPETNALIRTTIAATMFEGSSKENVLPPMARAVVNFRILPGDRIDTVIDHVRRSVNNPQVTIRPLAFVSEPSRLSDTDSSIFRMLQQTIHEVFPEVVVAPSLVVGITDSRHYAELSTNIYRFSPIRMRKEDLSRIHGTNERIPVENYDQLIRFYVQLIHNSAL
jgi:carboxypeptidase PM20D1